MKRKLFNPIALICCIIVLMPLITDLNGEWTGVIKIPNGEYEPVTYGFTVTGNKLTGITYSPSGSGVTAYSPTGREISIDNGTVNGNNFKFRITVGGKVYRHTGKLYVDSCGLDIDWGGQKIHTTLKRRLPEPMYKSYTIPTN